MYKWSKLRPPSAKATFFFFFFPSEHTVTLLFSQETDGENEEGLHLLL